MNKWTWYALAAFALAVVIAGILFVRHEKDSYDTSYGDEADPYSVTGFRSAEFGMNADQVRAAIRKDFSATNDQISEVVDPLQQTKSLVVRVQGLVPGAGNAEIGYVLGFKSKNLVQVNILWSNTIDGRETAQTINRTQALLRNYFSGKDFKPGTVVQDSRQSNGAVLVFKGDDAKGREVRLTSQTLELVAKPSAADSEKKDKAAGGADVPSRSEVYMLRLSYLANPRKPDIFRLKDGQF